MDYSNAIATFSLVIVAFVIVAFGFLKHANASEITYEQKLDNWIYTLILEESGGREDIQIVDSNNAYSRGCGMFQDKTWAHYTETYDMPSLDVFNCEHVKLLIRTMILDHYNNWAHWRCSVVDTWDSDLCMAAFDKMGWPYKEGIGKPPLPPLTEKTSKYYACKV